MAQSFQDALQTLINQHSMENGSDTPDWMLAEYLCDCLATYEVIIQKRERWYGRGPRKIEEADIPTNVPIGENQV